MKNKIVAILFLLVFIPTMNTHAQNDPSTPEKGADELAKELANPNATLGTMAFPIDFTFYNGDLPDANKQFSTSVNFQPGYLKFD